MGSVSDVSEINEVQEMSAFPYHLVKFSLLATVSNFYMIGKDKEGLHCRVLKIGRSEPYELVIDEDPTIYSSAQCKGLLRNIKEGNKLTGGYKLVTTCYGIVGFIRFSGPYYIIVITKRKEIGKICGHAIYGISEYKMIPIPHSTVWSDADNSEIENRYKKLLCIVDITKDFFFSYSYPIMHSLQKNFSQEERVQTSYGKMFVWNEYLTRAVRYHLRNNLWTVPLVHGFFKQVELTHSEKTFSFTLIARRSCQFAGTRYQKRGINEDGQAANDVEIEQIVCKDIHAQFPYKTTSSVQQRSSIAVPWSQKPSWLNLKPDIIFSEGENSYAATQLHFRDLLLRYGAPIFVLNLVKVSENESRESLLEREFRSAIDCINMDLREEDQLKYRSVDVDAVFRGKGTDVLMELKDPAACALKQVGFFSCQMHQPVTFKATSDLSYYRMNSNHACFKESECNNKTKLQKGILRTNCLDSLDRTNVAQFVYSLIALGHQLHDLKITGVPDLGFHQTLAHDLMRLYEAMGNALAQQYGGSAAHSKIFSKIRGQCEAATQILEFVKTVQRHYSNSFLDADKQKAIDIFLGNFQPEVHDSAALINNFQKNNSGGFEAIGLKTTSRCTPDMPPGRLLFDLNTQWFESDEYGLLHWNG